MSNKLWEAMKIAMNSLNPNEKNMVLIPDGELSDNEMVSYTLSDNFEAKDVLSAIGDTKLIGIIDSDKLNEPSVSELVYILTNENKATIVRLNTNPVGCRIFYPIPKIGTRALSDNYEYSYGQGYNEVWTTISGQNGWGVRIVDNTQADYASPLATIQGHPVTNMSYLFYNSPATTINLVDWDTSNITNMSKMFYMTRATSLNLNGFDTSKVVNMKAMFLYSNVRSLDLSWINTSNVTDMSTMFVHSQATDLDLSSFNTSKVTNMNDMFYDSQATSINLSSFDTTNVTGMGRMFQSSKAKNLDLSSFDTSKVTDMERMFDSSQVKTLKAKSNADAAKYKVSGYFPFGVIVTI